MHTHYVVAAEVRKNIARGIKIFLGFRTIQGIAKKQKRKLSGVAADDKA